MKKALLIASALFVVLFSALQVYIYLRQPTPAKELRVKAAVLPSLSLTGLDGSEFSIPGDKPVVLVYFNATCDHCQRQVEAMQKASGQFEDTAVIFMSSQPLEDLRSYFLHAGLGNFFVVHVRPEEVSERFGVLALPQIFVYDANRQLRDLFTGETSPEQIVHSLR